jgi:hypothetical protein
LSTTQRSRRPTPGAQPPAAPTPQELVATPELAVLAALQHLIELVSLSLAASHPELAGERSLLRPLDPQAVLADQLIQLGARLARATTRYRVAVIAALHRPDTDDLPF